MQTAIVILASVFAIVLLLHLVNAVVFEHSEKALGWFAQKIINAIRWEDHL